ncbi:carboxylating nicotinate-nucleotide diphosphorylase [Bacillus sp. FSL W7-1360]
MNTFVLDTQIEQFLQEDIGRGDVTTEAIFTTERAEAVIVAKEAGIFAGEKVVERMFTKFGTELTVKHVMKDGESLVAGVEVLRVHGSVKQMLIIERVLLNLLQRLCGIATLTRRAVETLADPTIRLCDTRKTTPGLRMLEKYAVRIGGGCNHRKGLDDAVMLKENHIAACGSIAEAVARVRQYAGPLLKIEVETTNEDEIREAVAAQADVIMFDNSTPDEIKRYVQLVPETIATEASGGISMETLPLYRGTKVDYLSLGFLTHSVRSIDLSMLIQKLEIRSRKVKV